MKVRLLKPMELQGGYVPRRHVQESTPRWHGIPLTLKHPEKNGRYVSVNGRTHLWKGAVLKPRWTGEFVQGKATFFDEVPAVSRRLENGESVSVSAAYAYDPLPPGVYDGQYRKQVGGNLKPDHVAVLLHSEGVCSVEDGCELTSTSR